MWSVLILLICTGPNLVLSCPGNCECYNQTHYNIVVCETRDIQLLANSIHPNTTHLLIYLEDVQSSDKLYTPSFKHLESLQVLLLDRAGTYGYSEVYIDRSSFPKASKIHKFASGLRLNFAFDTFADMEHLESLSLSRTDVKWEAFHLVMNASLCGKQYLRRLDLSKFSRELGTSPTQKDFKPQEVFAGCQIPSMQELILKNNDIVRLYGDFYTPFPNLSILDLSYNAFFDSDFFATDEGIVQVETILLLNNLHTVDLGHQGNVMSDQSTLFAEDFFYEADIPQPRKKCDLISNKRWVTKLLNTPKRLRDVSLTRNLCCSLEKILVGNLIGSPSIDINKLIKVHDNILPPLDVSYVDFAYNNFVAWTFLKKLNLFQNLKKLEYLNAQGNNLLGLPQGFFQKMTSLETLLLGYNTLGTIINERMPVGPENSNLRSLDLAFNNIT